MLIRIDGCFLIWCLISFKTFGLIVSGPETFFKEEEEEEEEEEKDYKGLQTATYHQVISRLFTCFYLNY